MKMKKVLVLTISIATAMGLLAGCAGKGTDNTKTGSSGKEIITMWFWGAEPYSQEAMN